MVRRKAKKPKLTVRYQPKRKTTVAAYKARKEVPSACYDLHTVEYLAPRIAAILSADAEYIKWVENCR